MAALGTKHDQEMVSFYSFFLSVISWNLKSIFQAEQEKNIAELHSDSQHEIVSFYPCPILCSMFSHIFFYRKGNVHYYVPNLNMIRYVNVPFENFALTFFTVPT